MSKERQLIFESAARTAATSATASLESCSGLFFIDVTALTSGASITFTISGLSPTPAGTAYTILASAAITATGLTVLRVSPQLTAAANTIAKDMLPAAIKVSVAVADTKSVTYAMEFVGCEC
jgi:hypothetical protein